MSRGLRYIAICLLFAPLGARADTLYWLGSKLPNGPTYEDGGGDPFKYYIDGTESSPGGLPLEDVETHIKAAFGRWQAVDCAYIGFSFQGVISDASQLGIHADTKSVIGGFVESASDPRYDDDLGHGVAVGVALTYANNGVILGCDTEYNHASYHFTEDTPATAYDFPSLANHEEGHCQGLDHDPDDATSVMFPTYNPGDMRRDLSAHDIDNICQLYPETGSVGSPCSGSSCGNGLSCIQNPFAGGFFCSQGCAPTDATSCPAGFGCRSSSAIGGSAGACYPGNGDFSPNIGASCDGADDCHATNATCFNETDNLFPSGAPAPDGYCSQICDAQASDGVQVCPNGDLCEQLSAGGHFYCMGPCKTTAAAGTLGACRDGYACYAVDIAGDGFCYPACGSDEDCGGNHCLCDGVCYLLGNGDAHVGSACVSANDCPSGGACVPSAGGWPGGYCIAACGAGQNQCRGCDPGAQCVIAGDNGEAYCLQSCDSSADCRAGYTCGVRENASHQQEKICLPGCASANDCPVGESCVGGACIDPNAPDGGACVLCGDGGVEVTTSGGNTSGGSTGTTTPASPAGCGCGAGSGSAAGLFAFAVVALTRARRRTW